MTVNQPREFFGRSDVLETMSRHLEAVVQESKGRIIAVRGRRQVGKSTAIGRFVRSASVPYVYVTGVFQASVRQQLSDATQALTQSTRPIADAGLLSEIEVGSWRDWFGRLALAAKSDPVIAVLDEFPWMTEADSSLEGELQAQWDRTLENSPVLLILIGSDVEMMQRLTTHGRPLFGRTRQLVISALNPADVSRALPSRPAHDVFDAYLVTGGYPRLVADLAGSRTQDTRTYLQESLRDAFSPLVSTARLTLEAEFSEPQAAYQVLSAIGADESASPGFNGILSTIGDLAERKRFETAITRALRTLVDTKALVEREVPAWAPPNSKLRRYRVSDPYLRFWFRYIERHVENISRGRADIPIGYYERDWPSWRGRSIEPIVREALLRLAVSDSRLDGVESVKPWWVRDNSVEVDVVAATPVRTALLGTIKWRERGGVTAQEMARLEEQRRRIPNSGQALLAAVSPSGGAPRGADVAFSASDLLQAWEPART